MRKPIIIREADLDAPLRFTLDPATAGCIVQVSYAWTYDGGVIRRALDQSDRSTAYAYAELSHRRDAASTPYAPITRTKWRPCVIEED